MSIYVQFNSVLKQRDKVVSLGASLLSERTIFLFKSLIVMNVYAVAIGHNYIELLISIVATGMIWILVEEISAIGGKWQQLNKHLYSDISCQNDKQSQCTHHLPLPRQHDAQERKKKSMWMSVPSNTEHALGIFKYKSHIKVTDIYFWWCDCAVKLLEIMDCWNNLMT